MHSKFLACPLFLLGLAFAPLCAQQPASVPFHSSGNPILADGSYYSTDPAPIVVGDTLYILAGRDEAPPDVNDFIMNEWQLFATKDVASGNWVHTPHLARPEQLFRWAAPGRAYGGQIVEGRDHRFYLYAPVAQATDKFSDPFGVGVAVANSPLGPWTDAHPAGPIVSQAMPEASRIQNIDPTVMIDGDGRVYMYWGTFGQLLGVELAPDMVTSIGPVVHVTTLKGFFEAAWIFKRGQTYYMSYAANSAGPHSECTPALYHACLAYGTSDSPLGPWTYRGVLLDPVSSTTSHEGIIEFKKQWYLTYHTADAKGGGHFRRSVAIDKLEWDDSVSPARILLVKPTRAPQPPAPATRNIAAAARPSASNEPVPLQYWIKALNDGIVRANPLPPDMWASWTPHNPTSQWIQYEWAKPVTLNGSRIHFWADHPQGAGEGVAPPAAWHLEFWNGTQWLPVAHPSGYATATESFVDMRFDSVTTRCLRAVFNASGQGPEYAALAVEEWEALAPQAIDPAALPAAPEGGLACQAK